MSEVEEIVEDPDRIPQPGDCETEAVSDFIKLTVPELICSHDATDFRIYDLLIFSMGYINRKAMKESATEYWVQL